MRLFALLAAGSLLVACADTDPPRWPADGSLTVEEIAADGLTLRWPAALDESGQVAHYRILQEEDVIATVSGATLEHRVARLDDATEYRFGVLAIDAAENEGGRLYVTVRTADGTPPGWNRGARLTLVQAALPEGAPADAVATRTLHWGGANDDTGVTGFRVRSDGRVLTEVPGETTSHVLAPTDTVDALDVVAFDEAGNVSAPLTLGADPVVDGELDGEPEADEPAPSDNEPNAQEAPAIPRLEVQTIPHAAQLRDQLNRAVPRLDINRRVLGGPDLQRRFDNQQVER